MSPRRRSDSRRRRLVVARNTLLAVFIVSMAVSVYPGQSGAASAVGAAGSDTALPLTDSALTVGGRGAFAGVKVTVNQTQKLVNQAVSITWTGAAPTVQGPGRFGRNFFQIMQCWGDDDGTNPDNPGPSPEQCQAGAATAKYGGGGSTAFPNGLATTRVISRSDWQNYDPAVGTLDSRTTNVWRNFVAVDGTTVGIHVDPTYNPQSATAGASFWLNPYFNATTTNEIAAAATSPDGTGSELFTVDTGLEAPGLGCGQKVEPVRGGQPRIPKCWLVIVPRGDPVAENAGTPFENSADQSGVSTSPVADQPWKSRIAIPLAFNPVDSPCSIDAKDRRIVGSELIGLAISSWQPALCATPGAPPFVFGTVPDEGARQQIATPTVGAPGMAIVPRALSATDRAKPTLYAPVSLSGVVIGFNVERKLRLDAPTAETPLAGVRAADINLTPRLVAKMLTQSYTTQVDILGNAGYPWESGNPADLVEDPDFVQFNPEFAYLSAGYSKNFGGLMMPVLNSDSAKEVWEWILADPEAKAWLDGQADQWGMKVNPIYSTKASSNTNGVAFAIDGPPSNFPKADPHCLQEATLPSGVVPTPLCATDWLPYSNGMRDGARIARIATDGAKTALNPFAASADQAWVRDDPQLLGFKSMFALTDSSSAALYGLQVAKLSRAGDTGPSRTFIAADNAGLTKALEAMRPGSDASVLEPDPTIKVAGAYPLASLSYAMIRPLDLDQTARRDYSNFIRYAAGPGQHSGLDPGDLPPGYTPLPQSLRDQATAAAGRVVTLQPAAVSEAGPPVESGATSASSGQGGSSFPSSRTPATTPVVAVAPPADAGPAAASTANVGPLTPILALARNRFFIPALAGAGVVAALLALEITKRPRRAGSRKGPGV